MAFPASTEPLGLGAAAYALLVGIGLPLGAAWTDRHLARAPLPPRVSFYASAIVQHLVLGGLAVAVAAAIGLDWLGRPAPTGGDVALGLAVLGVAVGALAPYARNRVIRRDRGVYLVAPRTGGERALWVVISLLAGIGEEIAYRGVLVAIVAAWAGLPVGVAVAAVAFALAHLAQGWRATPIVLGFALAFHGLVLVTGSLWVAMAVHAAYDLVAGFAYGWLAGRYDYPREPLPPPLTPAPARTPS